MRGIVRGGTGETREAFQKGRTGASGIETPTREASSRMDRKRKMKVSSKDRYDPSDPDAKITRKKDGRTHLSNKAEHALDLDTGAVSAVTVQGADRGDARTRDEPSAGTAWNPESVQEDREAGSALSKEGGRVLTAEKGRLCTSVITERGEAGIRPYIPERTGGRRRRRGKERPFHADRRRIRSGRGKRWMRKRGACVERTFESVYDRGGTDRTHLRCRGNILKRLSIHIRGFNPDRLMKKLFGVGRPRSLQGRAAALR